MGGQHPLRIKPRTRRPAAVTRPRFQERLQVPDRLFQEGTPCHQVLLLDQEIRQRLPGSRPLQLAARRPGRLLNQGLRERDSLEQDRIAIDALADELDRRLRTPWSSPKV